LARVAQRTGAKGAGSTARWLSAADLRTELGFSAVIESLFAAGAVVLSNGKIEDDIQPMSLYEADHLLISAENAAAYLKIYRQTTKISLRVRMAIMSGVVQDEDALSRLKQHVSAQTVAHLDLPEAGTFAASSYWHIAKPPSYWPLPGVQLRVA